jgi:hypothetical protein
VAQAHGRHLDAVDDMRDVASISQSHVWLFGFWQLLTVALTLALVLVLRWRSRRLREWLQVGNVSGAAELAIKVGAIVAAVVALNVFQLKPHLTVDERCDARLNLGLVVIRYGSLAKVPPQLKTELKLSRKHQIGAKPIPLGTGKPGACGRPRPDLFARGSISVAHLTVMPTVASGGARSQQSVTVNAALQARLAASGSSTHSAAMQALLRALRAPPPLTQAQAKKASRAIARATTVTVRAFVRNIGRGDATSVKVDQPPGVWLAPRVKRANCETPPFDIASGEPAKVECFQTSGRKVVFTAGDFRAFGDSKPKVDDAWLWAIGASLLIVVLAAIVSEIWTEDWKSPAPQRLARRRRRARPATLQTEPAAPGGQVQRDPEQPEPPEKT